MDIADAKAKLVAKKNALLSEGEAVQIAIDVLDEKTVLAFPNLDVVIAEKEQAVLDKTAALTSLAEKQVELQDNNTSLQTILDQTTELLRIANEEIARLTPSPVDPAPADEPVA